MPYIVKKVRNKNLYRVINTQTGKIHAEGTTKQKAEAQVRLLNQLKK